MDLHQVVSSIYEEAIKWNRKTGKLYIDGAQLQSIAIKAFKIIPPLLLQKSSRHSKVKDHTELLQRKLKLWK